MAQEKESIYGEPEFQTLYASPSYREIDPSKKGAYKFILEGSKIVGVAWTDWAEGAGIISIEGDSDVYHSLRSYLSDMSSVQFPAKNAYTLLDTKAVTTSERSGPLQDALDAANYVIDSGEIPEEPEENWDD